MNYQISFSDIIILLKDAGFLDKNDKNINLSLKERYLIAKNKIKKNISHLKTSLHSLDKILKTKNNYCINSIFIL